MSTGLHERYANFERQNPLRQPSWRYAQALKFSRPKNNRYKIDPWIDSMGRFLRIWNQSTKFDVERRRVDLYYKYPAEYRAFDLWKAEGDGPTHMRYTVEARILAGQTNDEIAKYVCVEPEAIEAYEQVFFNVRDRLSYRDYICGQVLNVAAQRGSDSLEMDFTAKFFGYFGGPFLLDTVLATYDMSLDKPQTAGAAKATFTQHVERSLERKLAENVNGIQISRYNVAQLLEIHAKITHDLRKREDESDQGGSGIEKCIQAFQTLTPWNTGRDAREALLNSAAGSQFAGAMEQRAGQMYKLTAGQRVAPIERPLNRDN